MGKLIERHAAPMRAAVLAATVIIAVSPARLASGSDPRVTIPVGMCRSRRSLGWGVRGEGCKTCEPVENRGRPVVQAARTPYRFPGAGG